MKYPRLFVGPMSKEIVDIVIEYSLEKNILGLIPSRRQIENTGGYVNNWSTDQFSSYVKNKNKEVLLVRDHGGPGQGQLPDDGLSSLDSDIESNFNILHIDPWKECNSLEEGIDKTLTLIEHCLEKNEKTLFEVGTEEAIFSYTDKDLDKFLGALKSRLGDKFHNIKYAVIQSGVRISGTQNIGNFDKDRLEKMVKVVKKYGLLSKEHNGDYLTKDQIETRAKVGLDSINIAPEFGVTQTRVMLDNQMIDLDESFSTCLEVNKFSKWLPEDKKHNPSKRLVVEVSGHYCFTKEPFLSSTEKSYSNLRQLIFDRFDQIHSAWK